jgi:hypothetical protein
MYPRGRPEPKNRHGISPPIRSAFGPVWLHVSVKNELTDKGTGKVLSVQSGEMWARETALTQRRSFLPIQFRPRTHKLC